MLIRYPRGVTVNNKRLIPKHKKSEKNMHKYKSHGVIKNYIWREITLIELAPSSLVLITSIHLENRNVFARFDEFPSMTL